MLQDKHRFTKRYIKLQTNNNTQFYMTGYETCYKTIEYVTFCYDTVEVDHGLKVIVQLLTTKLFTFMIEV